MSTIETPQPHTDAEPVANKRFDSVVVGLDGSSESDQALAWAIGFAGPDAVTPVAAYSIPVLSGSLSPGVPVDPYLYSEAVSSRLDEQLSALPQLRERAEVLQGHAGLTLARRAADSDLLVVGTRGRGAFKSALLGSTSGHCAKHAGVPVAVVPPDVEHLGRPRSIVVGVDGSANSDNALAWACRAVADGGTVHAVAALSHWNLTTAEYAPPEQVVEHQLGAIISGAIARVKAAGLPWVEAVNIVPTVIQLDARIGLPKAIRDTSSELLVVGARGSGGLPYLLLGSVASAIVHHPATATVVVPNPD